LKEDSFQDLEFTRFQHRLRKVRGEEVRAINQLIVRCAESLVFFRDDLPWVRKFVERNSRYRIEPVNRKIPAEGGSIVWTRLEVHEGADD
jgi:hypothetical protein